MAGVRVATLELRSNTKGKAESAAGTSGLLPRAAEPEPVPPTASLLLHSKKTSHLLLFLAFLFLAARFLKGISNHNTHDNGGNGALFQPRCIHDLT